MSQELKPYQRNDERAAKMYDRYQSGLSLAQVASEFGVSRQSVHEVFTYRQWPLRPRPEPNPTVIYRGRKYSLRPNGYFAATSGNREQLHRRIWMDAHGPIPDDWDIHHRDEDKQNNELSNLECLPKSEHTRLYSPRCNQFSHKCGKEGHENRVNV